MSKARFDSLRAILICLAVCCAIETHAQEPDADTTVADTGFYSNADSVTAIDGEYVPERPVIYNSSAPSAAVWQQATADKAYTYRDAREYNGKKEERPPDLWLLRLLYSIFAFFASPLGQILLWGALIAIVGYVIYRIVAGQGGWIFGAKDHRADSGNDAVVSEQSLLEADWESLMQKALQSGETRAAIRFSYLRLLQLLQQRGLISYRPDKTNIDYYRELADKPQRQDFRTVMRQYEWAWYGNIIPERATMDSYLQTFNGLKNSLVS